MSRGIFQSLIKLKDMIEAIDPKTDSHNGFVCIDDGTGMTSPLQARFEGQRQFAFELTTMAMDRSAPLRFPDNSFITFSLVKGMPEFFFFC